MTKQQEIEVLSEAIAKLGVDSYLGPWLSEVRAEVASLIRSDIFPDMSLQKAVFAALSAGKAITDQAKAEAANITKLAEQARAKAYNDAVVMRRDMGDALRQCERLING